MRAGCIGGGLALALLICSGFAAKIGPSVRVGVTMKNSRPQLHKPSAGRTLRQQPRHGEVPPESNDSYFWMESQPSESHDRAVQKPQRILHRI